MKCGFVHSLPFIVSLFKNAYGKWWEKKKINNISKENRIKAEQNPGNSNCCDVLLFSKFVKYLQMYKCICLKYASSNYEKNNN